MNNEENTKEKSVEELANALTEGMDEGPIIAQKSVEVRQDDTPETLQRRVMEEAEWVLLPRVIDDIAHGRIVLAEGKAIYRA